MMADAGLHAEVSAGPLLSEGVCSACRTVLLPQNRTSFREWPGQAWRRGCRVCTHFKDGIQACLVLPDLRCQITIIGSSEASPLTLGVSHPTKGISYLEFFSASGGEAFMGI